MNRKSRVMVLAAGAVVALFALALAGCTLAAAPDPAKLEGSWQLESFGGVSDLEPADPAVTTDMTLLAGKASGNGGVNSYGGSYETPGDNALTFGPMASTKMAGPDAAMAQEAKFFSALEKTEHFEFDGEKLVLSDAGNDTLAVMSPK